MVYVTRSFSDSFAVFQQSQTKSAGFTVDHNWAFTLPGPLMPIGTKDAYEGVTGQVWGSHVYYESTKQAYKELGVTDRPVALTRDNGCGSGWRAPWQHKDPEAQTLCGAGSPAHHRFPVRDHRSPSKSFLADELMVAYIDCDRFGGLATACR